MRSRQEKNFFNGFLRQLLLLVGDLLILYTSLGIALLIRRQFADYSISIAAHLVSFSALFAVWVVVFFAFSLYDLRVLKNNLEFLKLFGLAISVNIVLALVFFYLALPAWSLQPKTNFALFLVVFCVLFFVWRRMLNLRFGSAAPAASILLLGKSAEIDELRAFLTANPQLGYRIVHWTQSEHEQDYAALIKHHRPDFIVASHESKNSPDFMRAVIDNLDLGISVMDSTTLYEIATRKIHLSSIKETWFIEHLAGGRTFDSISRSLDVAFAILMGIVALPICVLIAPTVALASSGPIIYRQARVGKNGKHFTLYKFRTMVQNAEDSGPQWATEHDSRVTRLGRFLRKTHLDELPQLINIFKGELSLVGPRPERPEFVKDLKENIPYYNLRHLVRPGFTGWAQINYPYGSSTEDAYKKLQYDMYYLKNRSLALYLATLFKTIRFFFHSATRI